MVKQVQEAYIVAATRTPVGKAPRGMMRHVRPDDMLAHVITGALAQVPTLDPKLISDCVVGCAFPEAEQGLNMARIGVLLAGCPIPLAVSPSTVTARPVSMRYRWRLTAFAWVRPMW
jgi:acetyl-CoA acyltransferase